MEQFYQWMKTGLAKERARKAERLQNLNIQNKPKPNWKYIAKLTGTTVEELRKDGAAAYGTCPACSEPVMNRERRVDGNDQCYKGHYYPSSATIKPKEKQSWFDN